MRIILNNVIVRLLTYYAVLLAVFDALLRFLPPWAEEAIIRERARNTGGGVSISDSAEIFSSQAPTPSDIEILVPIALALLGALCLSLPVAWVYQWTRRPEPYRRDFARALVALPIGVALAVFLVKGSLPLAFSLAGIVAAIRWRAALSETMDGVFMFVVIGIGLAAGVQFLMVAFVASVIFNAVILMLAHSGYAARPQQLSGWSLVKVAPHDDTASQLSHIVSLRVEVTDQARAEAHVENVLANCARQWAKLGASSLPGTGVRLEYRATLKKRFSPQALRDLISDDRVPEVGRVAIEVEG